MTMSDSALPLRAALTGDMPSDVASHVASHVASDVQLTFDDRHWRIRGSTIATGVSVAWKSSSAASGCGSTCW